MENDKKIRNFVKTTIREFINEQILNGNILTLYHGTEKNSLEIVNKNIWLAEDINYAKIWGDNIFVVEIKLNKILDTYNELGNKKLTLRGFSKYLDKKGVYTDEFKYVMRNYLDNEKFMFWSLISKHRDISYSWLSFDIFNSGYDAISVFEYGYTKRDKGKTFLVNNPNNKIISIKKIK